MNPLIEIRRRVYATELNNHIPDEMCVSWPIPGKRDGVVIDRFFLYGENRDQSLISGPYLAFDLATDAAKLKGQDLSVYQEGKEPTENKFAKNPTKEDVENFGILCMKVRSFAFEECDDARKKVLKDFVSALFQISGTGLLDIYYSVNREFFDWVLSQGIETLGQ